MALTSTDDTPVVSLSGDADPSFTEQGDPVAFDASLAVSDADDSDLEGATVTIGTGRGDGDVLTFTAVDGITGEYTADDGMLELTGTASKADYQTVLRSVKYANDLDDPSSATRTIGVIVDDGTKTSATVTRDLTFTAVDDVPVVTLSADADPAYTEQADAVALDANVSLADTTTPLSRARPSPSAPAAAPATRCPSPRSTASPASSPPATAPWSSPAPLRRPTTRPSCAA